MGAREERIARGNATRSTNMVDLNRGWQLACLLKVTSTSTLPTTIGSGVGTRDMSSVSDGVDRHSSQIRLIAFGLSVTQQNGAPVFYLTGPATCRGHAGCTRY